MCSRHSSNSIRVTVLAGRLATVLLVLALANRTVAEEKHPIYVGAKACAKCHRDAGMGFQHCRWLLSGHARAYASLADPAAKEIARLSGIPQEPQESSMCLGCHATGAHVEDWEKDEAFHVEDGVSCEKCHGPGSEYMDMSTMVDSQAAAAAGLTMPTKETLHEVPRSQGLARASAWGNRRSTSTRHGNGFRHPAPEKWTLPDESPLPGPLPGETKRPLLTGATVCGACHRGPEMGYQFSRWRMSKHANAYAVLATSGAGKIAREMGVKGNPLAAKACLKCHTTAHHDPAGGARDSYDICEGVGCEACHGAGGDYSREALMRDPDRASHAGLKPVDRRTCVACHENAHGKPFDYEAALAKVSHPTGLPPVVESPQYKTPLSLALSPDARELYVTCEASHTVIVIDVVARRKTGEIPVGHHPTEVTFHPDGKHAYVSNRLDDSVSVISVPDRKVTQTLSVGDEPHGVLTDRQGKHLYVLNTSSDSISVIDTESLVEVKRLEASRNPWSLSLSPDGSRISVTNALSRFVPFRTPSMSEITVIDTASAMVIDRMVVPSSNLLQGIAWHPSGRFALTTHNRTKNLVPMTRLLQGWTITNGLGVVWADGRVDQVLLDEPSLCFPDPAGVTITPDGRLALVTSSGSDRVAVVDVTKLIAMLQEASDEERRDVFPNHLGKPTEFVIKHIPTKNSPRGVLITPDGRTAFVANALDDSLTVIDIDKLAAAGRIDLGGPKVITKVRYGERLFHSADITFHRQFSCHSCHPDGHVDGLTYDIEPDGLGASPVDNRTLRGILDTAPFKWEGTNPSLQRQCGPRLSVFFTRLQPFTPRQLSALDNYICTIPRPPNRYRPLGAELTEAQRHGKILFERTIANDGRVIPVDQRCVTCHFPPLYTDRSQRDVDTKMTLDRESHFDVPHLSNIYDSAPYLHNGIAQTLEEIWTRYNPNDKHGVTNDMTKDQLNDLIEYLKTL